MVGRRWFRFALMGLGFCFGRTIVGQEGSPNRLAPIEAAAISAESRSESIEWIRSFGGEFDADPDDPELIIAVRLDRTRGLDPLSTVDALQDDDLRHLRALAEVKQLTLEARDAFTDEGMAYLSNLTKLQSLNLRRTRINGSGLASLKHLPDLRDIDLSYCSQLANDSLVHLVECPSLESLTLDQWGRHRTLDDKWKHALRHRRAYREVNIPIDDELAQNRGGVDNTALQHIGRIKSLRRLSLRLSSLTDAGLTALQGLQQLEELDLSYTTVSGDGLRALARLPNLRRLVLDFTYLGDEDLSVIKDFPQLIDLSIRGTGVGDIGVAALSTAVNLRRLNLESTAVSDRGLRHLGQLSRLEELHLKGAEVTLQGAAALTAALPQFSWQKALLITGLARADEQGEIVGLDLRRQLVSDDELRNISRFGTLRFLDVSNSQITDQGLAEVAKLSALESLHLANTSVTDAGIAKLADNRSLKMLTVDNTRVTLAGVLGLFIEHQGRSCEDALMATRRLTASATGRKVDLRGLAASGTSLKSLLTVPDVRDLFVDGGQLNDDALSIIASHASLEAIWIDGGTFGPDGVAALANLPKLNVLWLTHVALSDHHVQQFEQIPQLITLNLSGCPLTPGTLTSSPVRLPKLRTLIVGSLDADPETIASIKLRFPRTNVIVSQRDAIALVRESPQHSSIYTIVEGPDDLRSRFGNEYFEQAAHVNFNNFVPRRGVRGLTTLTRAGVVFSDDASSVIAELASLPNLTSLSLYASNFGDEDLEPLVRSPQLAELDLQRTPIGDGGLERVGRMLGLKQLALGGYGVPIDDEGLRHVAGLKQLERLDLSRTDVTDAGLVHLTGLRNLKELQLRETKVNAGVTRLAVLSQLERLDLSFTNVTDDTAISLAAIRGLKAVDFSHTMVTAAGAESLKVNLAELIISPNVFPHDDQERRIVQELGSLGAQLGADQRGRVAEVDARDASDQRRAVHLVRQLQHIRTLRVGVACTDDDLEGLREVATLVDVDLSDSKVTDRGLIQLRGLTELKKLNLARTATTDAAAPSIVRHRGLVMLSLAGTNVTDATLRRLNELPQLASLSLDRVNVTGRGLAELQPLAALKYLYIRDIPGISDKDIDALQQSVPNCSIVRSDSR
ncbi:MAG: hypothetical protein JNL18_01050 [Planctomycetaceae bacterium]|nr:hypothetical protein [Planctomycetaceae bacterium]